MNLLREGQKGRFQRKRRVSLSQSLKRGMTPPLEATQQKLLSIQPRKRGRRGAILGVLSFK
ncbi:hypothetical protein A2U01_0097345, partial [Trifolium medium]|nr:hypothetical protein [Trifolium medium]